MSDIQGWPIKSVPTAVVVALAIQTGGALIWVGSAQARIDAVERRLEGTAAVAERLARLEAQAAAVQAALERIEDKMDGRR